MPEYLEYYVVVGKVVFLGDFKGQNVKTLNGDAVNLSGAEKAEYKVNNATVVRGDIFVTNRVIHVLDRSVPPCLPSLTSWSRGNRERRTTLTRSRPLELPQEGPVFS